MRKFFTVNSLVDTPEIFTAIILLFTAVFAIIT
jgi:hypothetical protein